MKKFIIIGMAIVMSCTAITACGRNDMNADSDNRSYADIAEDYLTEKGVEFDHFRVEPYIENGEEYMAITATENDSLKYYGEVDVSYAAK